MGKYHVRVVGGSCGASLFAVAEHLECLFEDWGYDCRVTTQNIWQSPAAPVLVDLLLQLMPAFSAEEVGCPVINIKPLLIDMDHAATIARIREALQAPQLAPAGKEAGLAGAAGVDSGAQL